MKGLILKDFYIVIKQFKTIFIVDFVFWAVSIFASDSMLFMIYPCILSGIIPLNLIAYDEQAKWEKYAGVLPYSRMQIVSGKYIMGLVIGGATVAVTAVVQACRLIKMGSFAMDEYIGFLFMLAVISLLLPVASFPLIFKFGFVKARIFFYIFIGLICGSILSFVHFEKTITFNLNRYHVMLIILVVVGLLYAASWYLSVQFYKKREL